MVDKYLLESGGTDGYGLEDGTGDVLIDAADFPVTVALTAYAVTGNNATTVRGRVINPASPMSYTITGSAATAVRGRVLSASPGSYTITGVASTDIRGRVLSAGIAAYSITGVAVSLPVGRWINAGPASYLITGNPTTLIPDHPFTASPGSYAITGISASTLADRVASASPGSYSITGVAAVIARGRYLNTDPGDYSVTGISSSLIRGRVLSVSPASYAITGNAASVLHDSFLSSVPGAYAVTGFGTTLSYIHETKWFLRSMNAWGPITIGEKSDAKPASAAVSSANVGAAYESRALKLVAGTSQTNLTIQSSASTSHQDQYMARFLSDPLAAQTIATATWTLAIATSEANAGANSFTAPSLYIWNPRTRATTFIYDSDTALGAEWSTTEDGQVLTFTGSEVITEDGDILVLEIWRHAASQASATAYTQTLYFDGATEVTDSTTTDAGSYVSAPLQIKFRWSK